MDVLRAEDGRAETAAHGLRHDIAVGGPEDAVWIIICKGYCLVRRRGSRGRTRRHTRSDCRAVTAAAIRHWRTSRNGTKRKRSESDGESLDDVDL